MKMKKNSLIGAAVVVVEAAEIKKINVTNTSILFIHRKLLSNPKFCHLRLTDRVKWKIFPSVLSMR